MDVSRISVNALRSFHRTVTERVGALDEEYLARPRPLGASRLLWEIGDSAELRELRTRLDLDSGYLTRLLRRLVDDGLVDVVPDERDGRVRLVTPTEAGRRERALLDDRSDALARSLLEPLNERQRNDLIAAVRTVERLLTAGLVAVDEVDPGSETALWCIEQYFTELAVRFEGGFDETIALAASPDDLRRPAGLFLVARLRGRAIGCGAAKLLTDRPAEIKRMWVDRSARGLGVGRRLLGELERRVRQAGHDRVRLETNRSLTEAISMYRTNGYVEIEPFNDEPYAHHWFERRLD